MVSMVFLLLIIGGAIVEFGRVQSYKYCSNSNRFDLFVSFSSDIMSVLLGG